MSGPTKIPIGPRSDIPPKTAKSIRSGGMFIFPPTTIGLSKLSTKPTIITDQIKSPIAAGVLPEAKRKRIAGTETKLVPIIGTSEAIAATTPQSAAFGTPKIVRPTPISSPCTKAMSR